MVWGYVIVISSTRFNLSQITENFQNLASVKNLKFLLRNRVLQQNDGIEHGLGGIQWELAGCLLLAWVCVYLIIWKGLHSSGKVNLSKTAKQTVTCYLQEIILNYQVLELFFRLS